MWSNAARNRGSNSNMLKLQNLNLPTYEGSRGSKKQPILTNQRIRWLGALLILGLIVWVFVRYSRSKEEFSAQPPYAGPHQALVDEASHGFLPLSEARDFCQNRRWEPYATRVCNLFLLGVVRPC